MVPVALVLIDKVEVDSPAAKANLRQGDVISAFNGEAIKGPRDLAMDVANVASGTTAKMTIFRDGHESVVDVTIGDQPGKTAQQTGDTNGPSVGLALAPLNEDAQQQLGLDPSVRGVVVAQVTPGSRADESGMRAGDVIVRVGDDAVTTPAEASARIHAAEHDKKEAVPLLVMRDGTTYYLALQLAKA